MPAPLLTTLSRAITNPDLLGGIPAFKDPSTWAAWVALDKAVQGEDLDTRELELFRRCTGRTTPRAGGYAESVAVTARRCGKSTWHGVRLAFDAASRTMAGAGKGLFYVVVAQDLRGAQRAAFEPVRAVFEQAAFRELVARTTADAIELVDGSTLAIYPPSHSVRGLSLGGAWLDELAFLVTSEGRAADTELLRSVRPGLLTTPGARLYVTSSPYAMSGALYALFKKHHGEGLVSRLVGQSGTLVWQSDTSMNPTLDSERLAALRSEDPEAAVSELDGQFRQGLSALFDAQALDACVVAGLREVPPRDGIRYGAAFDASSGRGDRAVLAIGHAEGDTIHLDALRTWSPPFDPEAVGVEAVQALRPYRVSMVQIDRFAAPFVAAVFARHGVRSHVSIRTTSENHVAAVAVVNAGRVRLLDLPDLLRELRGLERRTSRGGQDRADHRSGEHDDRAAAVTSLLAALGKPRRSPISIAGDDKPKEPAFEVMNPEIWDRWGSGHDEERRKLGLPPANDSPSTWA